jgi:hypothetical protein
MYRDLPPEPPPAPKTDDDRPQPKHHVRGKNWALVDANSQSTPIRRTIQMVVRGDRVVILPDGASPTDPNAVGQEIPIAGSGRDAYEPLLIALEKEIKDWGMAGRGLYWRPVLDITIGPDGERRANDITRVLKNSGIELRAASVIAAQHQGTSTGASSTR